MGFRFLRHAALFGLLQIGFVIASASPADAEEAFNVAAWFTAKFPGIESNEPEDFIFFPLAVVDDAMYDVYIIPSKATDLAKAVPVVKGILAKSMGADDIPDEYKTWIGASLTSFVGQKIKVVRVRKAFAPQTLKESPREGNLGSWEASGVTYSEGDGYPAVFGKGAVLWRTVPDYPAAGKVVVTVTLSVLPPPSDESWSEEGGSLEISVDGNVWQDAIEFYPSQDGIYSADITSHVKDAAKNGTPAMIRFINKTLGYALVVKSVEITATP